MTSLYATLKLVCMGYATMSNEAKASTLRMLAEDILDGALDKDEMPEFERDEA